VRGRRETRLEGATRLCSRLVQWIIHRAAPVESRATRTTPAAPARPPCGAARALSRDIGSCPGLLLLAWCESLIDSLRNIALAPW
jgi:hypothetical protein